MGFGAAQILSGATKLSELGIDLSKNWLGYLIKNLGDPVDAQDAATRAWILTGLAYYLEKAGGVMSGDINMNDHNIYGLPTPLVDYDAATKKYVDDAALGSPLTWKSESEQALYLENQEDEIVWTSLDLTALTSANATVAILLLHMIVVVMPIDGQASFGVRKNGTTPDWWPFASVSALNGDEFGARTGDLVLCGMDSGQKIEYSFSPVGAGTKVKLWINVLGYFE